MLERKPSKSFKCKFIFIFYSYFFIFVHILETQSYDSDYKNHLASDDPKLRILQYDLVFVNGLPSHISSKEVIIYSIVDSNERKLFQSIW